MTSHYIMGVHVLAYAITKQCRDSRAPSQRAAAVSQSSQWPLAAAEQGGGQYSSLVHRSPQPYGGGERAWQAAMQCGKGRGHWHDLERRWWMTMASLIFCSMTKSCSNVGCTTTTPTTTPTAPPHPLLHPQHHHTHHHTHCHTHGTTTLPILFMFYHYG